MINSRVAESLATVYINNLSKENFFNQIGGKLRELYSNQISFINNAKKYKYKNRG